MLLSGKSITHMAHQPALVRATHLLLEKTIINSVNWTLQTGQRVYRGDMDTYFVMYRGVGIYIIIKHCYTLQTATFAFHKVVRRHYSGEVRSLYA